MRHLYRVLSLSAHVLLSYCVEYVLFDLFYHFYACAGFSMFCAHFHSGLVPENNYRSSLSITATIERPRVVLK